MDFHQALTLQLSGRYSELLRSALAEQQRAVNENRPEDQLHWTVFIVKASRFLGRTNEAIVHANHALQLGRQLGTPSLEAEALHALAISFKTLRRYDDSLDMLAKAAELLPGEGSESLKAAVFLERAETALETGNRRIAETELTRGSAVVNWLGEPRLLAWTLYLKSQLEEVSPADLQLTTAYTIARTVECPELQWQILWRLAERAGQYGREKMHEDFLTRAIDVLHKLAEPLHPSDASTFWRQGARRQFVEQTQKSYGKQLFQKVIDEGPQSPGNTTHLLRDMGWDPDLIPKYIRVRMASQVQWP